MSEIKLTKENFESEILKSDKPCLVDFWAPWCGPCRMLSPIVEELANEIGDKAKVGKVNVDDEQELAMKYQVSSIPTIIIFKDGKIVDSSVGYRSKEDLIDLLNL